MTSCRPFLLINTNISRPPVSPVGLEYVGESLVEAGVPVRVLDFAFVTDWKSALAQELQSSEPLAVGVSVRNTDDCSFATRRSFLPWIRQVVAEARKLTRAPVILGGVGYSVMPEVVLEVVQADAGIAGDGEEIAAALARCLVNNEAFSHLPGIVFRNKKGKAIANPRKNANLRHLPVPRRRLFDNKKYEQMGAMVGIETKRGCSQHCVFCADPVTKGSSIRLRPPATVVQEFQDLLSQGVSWFHLGDSEFNLPVRHAKEVCRAVIAAGLGDKLRWYTYCAPTPFDRELASLMKRAGCAGINFGVDSLCDEQLSRLGRSHNMDDIRELVCMLNGAGLNYIFDLLVGGPGETEDTAKATINKVRELDIPLAGIAAGVRIYPGTPLGKAITSGAIRGGLHPEKGDFSEPVFYLSPHLGGGVGLVNELIAGNPRFLALVAPDKEGSYNYADDDFLCRLIEAGARGTYWDIISRSRLKVPKES